MPKATNPHEAKVKEIRDNFAEDFKHWEPIYKEGELNMKFLTDPWNQMDRQDREAAGRPIVTFDEWSQYLNQAQNEVRMSPRAPQFSPESEGATEETARVYGNSFRRVEYLSNAQEAYATAYDNALTRGFSFSRLKLEYEHSRSFYQRATIEPVPNPACCYPDSNSLKTDGADWKRFTYIEKYTKDEFTRTFPEAEFTDFSTEQIAAVGASWMSENTVQVAEYWEVETKDAELVEYEVPATKLKPQRIEAVIEGVDRKPRGGREVQRRVTEVQTVYSYFTNGVELLKKAGKVKHLYPGTMIPFAPCYGKVLWVNEGSGPTRKIISLITMARNPGEAYCFAASCELEAIGTITKNPYWAYEGTLDVNLKNRVKLSLHQPVAILEAKAQLPGLPGVLIPLPVRNPMSVDLSAYALVKEGARRAIEAAMRGVPLQTQMQRDNQKLSGRALDRMQDQGQRGNFHYIDHYNGMLRRIGVIYEDVFDKITDVEREIITLEADKTVKRVRLGGWNGKGPMPQKPPDLAKDVDFLPGTKGRHATTVDVGPAKESDRQDAVEFLDNFIASPLFASLEPPKRDKLMSMSIKERLTGPIGQKMAEVIDPKPQGELPPPEQLMGMLQQGKQHVAMLEKELQFLQQQQEAKVTETEGKMAITAQQDKTKVAIAQMQVEQKTADTVGDNETAITIQHMKNEIELLKLHLGIKSKGAELEHATAMAERGHSESASEADKSREAASDEAERGRQATAAEGQANRDAAAEAAEDTE